MLKELPWAMCIECGQSSYLEGDSCLKCGFAGLYDKPGSSRKGTIKQYNGGLPSNRKAIIGKADEESYFMTYFIFKNNYSFYEIDHILRLELGESFTMKTYVLEAECYEIISWIKTSN